MNFSFARLRAFLGSLFSSHSAQRKLLVLALLVQGACAGGYLYLEHRWIETDVVQSLKNVSSMHLRSIEQLRMTRDYQLTLIGKSMQDMGDGSTDLHAQLQTEVKKAWLDTVTVLTPDGNIVDTSSVVPLESALPPRVLATHSFRDYPIYQDFHNSGAESNAFFVHRPGKLDIDEGGIEVYRAIKSTDGHALGTVVGFTSLHSLSALLNTDITRGFDLGKNGILGFIDQRTHKWLYRYTYGGNSAEMKTVPSQVISPLSFKDTRYGPEVKSYQSSLDSVERLVVTAPLHNGQWLQVVAASKDEYLFNWRLQVAFSILAFAGMCVLQWLLLRFFQQHNQQRKLLNLILDTVDAYVYFKTSERRFVYANAKTAALFGLPAEQITGRLDSEILPQSVADDFWVMDSHVFTSNCKQSEIEIVTTPDGETHYYNSIKVPVHLAGLPPALIGISTDVTELHQQTIAREAAEKALATHYHSLQLNNQVLEMLGQNATLPAVFDAMLRIIDDYRPGMSGAVLLVSNNGRELTGCAAPNIPESWFRATAHLPVDEMNGPATAAVRSGETVIIEDVTTDPRCATVYKTAFDLGFYAAWAHPIKNNAGMVLGVFNLYQRELVAPDAHDLVLLADYARLAQIAIERSRMADALQKSQALYRLIAENSNDLIWVMEYPFLTCSYVSPSAERLRGWTAEEILQQRLEDMVSSDSVRLVNKTLKECLQRIREGDLMGRFFTLELEHLHKDSHVVPVEVKGTIMLSKDARPTHIIGCTRDITERKAAEDIIKKMAFFDQLTGLPNRRMMENQLGQMLALAKREHRKLSLLFVDLDKFKGVNDQHGHKAGDWLLVQVALRMSAVLRTSDTVSRLGGDEFVILLPDTQNAEEAVLVAEKIRAALEKPFIMDDGVELNISSSIGVVLYPDQTDNVRNLLHFGDEAMYQAKKNGRNTVEVFCA